MYVRTYYITVILLILYTTYVRIYITSTYIWKIDPGYLFGSTYVLVHNPTFSYIWRMSCDTGICTLVYVPIPSTYTITTHTNNNWSFFLITDMYRYSTVRKDNHNIFFLLLLAALINYFSAANNQKQTRSGPGTGNVP